MFSSLNDFKHIMKAKTGCGYTCEIGCRKHSSNLHDVNCFVKCHGYHGLGHQWNAVNEQTVRNLMPYMRTLFLLSPSLLNDAIHFLHIFRLSYDRQEKNRHDVGRR